MIVHPLVWPPLRDGSDFTPAWESVARAQKTKAAQYYLVRQPDHAHLAAELAQHMVHRAPLDYGIVQGIALHDEGWAGLDDGTERPEATPIHMSAAFAVDPEGKPISFLEIATADFLRAWNASIEAAEGAAPVSGLIVSRHFVRLARDGVASGRYSPHEVALVRHFLNAEARRRERLLCQQQRSEAEIEYWTDVLQFCDLLSLYLCCGARTDVEFPQRIGHNGETFRLRVYEDVYEVSPRLFRAEKEFETTASCYPPKTNACARLCWRLR